VHGTAGFGAITLFPLHMISNQMISPLTSLAVNEVLAGHFKRQPQRNETGGCQAKKMFFHMSHIIYLIHIGILQALNK